MFSQIHPSNSFLIVSSFIISCVLYFKFTTEPTWRCQYVCRCGAVYWGRGQLIGAISLGEKLTLPFPSSHKLPMYKPMVALLVKPPRMGLCQSFPHPCCDAGILAGFISCMSYACSHSCEFMYAKALTCLTKGPIPMQEIKHTCFAIGMN